MAMSRRGFLLSTSLVPCAASVQWKALKRSDAPTLHDGVHILGPTPVSDDAILVRAMSDDVFERLRRAVRGRTLQVVPGTRVVLAYQWNTSVEMGFIDIDHFHRVGFPLSWFRWATDTCPRGAACCPARPLYGADLFSVPDPDPAQVFAELRSVGMPILPSGLTWAAHYMDEDTGMVMRVVALADILVDELVVRWDVIGSEEG